jgi:hypothetical protein
MFKLPQCRVLSSAFLLFSVLPASAADAPTIYRCESATGVVSYGNSPCPAGTRASRTLDNEPTLATPAADDKSVPSDAREAGKITPAKRGQFDPWVEDRRLSEQIAEQRRMCVDIERRVVFARRDLDAVAPGRAASAELELRRAQDQYQLHCARR